MPKEWRIPFAFLAIVLFVGVGVAATRSFTAPYDDPCAQYAKASEYERHKGCMDSAATQSIAEYTQWLAYFTVILAIGTLGLGAIGFWQGSLARAEFNATHRPRIKVVSIVRGTSVNTAAKTATATFITRYVNVGTSVAIVKEIGTQIIGGEPAGEIRFEHDPQSHRLESGEEDTHHFSVPNRSPVLGPFYAGFIRYEDTAGRTRKTSFLWHLNAAYVRWERVKDSPYDNSF